MSLIENIANNIKVLHKVKSVPTNTSKLGIHLVEGGGVYIVAKDPVTPTLKVVKKIYESSDYYMKGSVDAMLSAQKQLLDDADAILQSQVTAVQQTTATHTAEIQNIKDEYVANKGYYNSLVTLQAAYPTPDAGDIAYVANVASTTGYYIYNVVGGAWTASSVEAPPVSVPISNYAEHGYTGTPKTLKTVEDEKASEIAQLAGDIKDLINRGIFMPDSTGSISRGSILDFGVVSGIDSGKEYYIKNFRKTNSLLQVVDGEENIISQYFTNGQDQTGIAEITISPISPNTEKFKAIVNWDAIGDIINFDNLHINKENMYINQNQNSKTIESLLFNRTFIVDMDSENTDMLDRFSRIILDVHVTTPVGDDLLYYIGYANLTATSDESWHNSFLLSARSADGTIRKSIAIRNIQELIDMQNVGILSLTGFDSTIWKITIDKSYWINNTVGPYTIANSEIAPFWDKIYIHPSKITSVKDNLQDGGVMALSAEQGKILNFNVKGLNDVITGITDNVQIANTELIQDNTEDGYFTAAGNPANSADYIRTIRPVRVYNLETNIYTYEGYLYTTNSIVLFDEQMNKLQAISGAGFLYNVVINDYVTVDKSKVKYMHLSSVKANGMHLSCSESHGEIAAQKSVKTSGRMYVSKSADALNIVSKCDSQRDIFIHFEKCMYNMLFTYKEVSLMNNSMPYVDTDLSRAKTNIVTTSSDNIGPLNIAGGAWTGGNHSYMNEGNVKTAETEGWTVFADGVEIIESAELYADVIEVKVRNLIYDPRIAPQSGAEILDTLLCYEDVIYRIERGDMSVSLTHTFVSDVTINNYYGQQTVCTLDEIMTSQGNLNNFVPRGDATNIPSTYAYFDRWVQRRSDKSVYESMLLNTDYKLGIHSNIGDTIAIASSNKLYQVLIDTAAVVTGQKTSWNALYSWRPPISDVDEYIVFEYTMNGMDTLAVNLKNNYNGYVNLQGKFTMKKFDVIKKSNDMIIIDEIVHPDGLELSGVAGDVLYVTI